MERPDAERWAMDEHRIGLKPIVRAVWAKRGERPVVTVKPRYEWLYVYGFVRPETGETSFWLSESVNTETMSAVLGAFARERAAAPGAAAPEVDLVLDGAGWHTSPKVSVPAGVSLVPLPAYSPELQPAEHLWPVIDEAVANRLATDLVELESWVAERCVELSEERERVRSLTQFRWWPGGGAP